jgi:hypothetical protein
MLNVNASQKCSTCVLFHVTVWEDVRGPPDEVYNHQRPSRYSRPPCDYLQTPSRHLRHLRRRRDLITIGSLVTTTTPAIRRSLRTLSERCSNHQMHLDAFRYATLDGGSRGSLPQVRFLIRTSLFYFVTRFLYIVSPSAGKTLDFSLWFSLARCVYIFDVFVHN